MRTWQRRGSFWTAAAVAGVVLWASGAPTEIYPLYAAEWHLTPAVTTLIFAIYPAVLVPTLLVFGNISDSIGRRASILVGLTALALGTLLFALAVGLPDVLLGRALMGVGVGFALSPATAAMIDYGDARRAGPITTASTATGLAASTLIGGALVQYVVAPTRTPYWVLLAVIVVVALASSALPGHLGGSLRSWRPRGITLPPGRRAAFVAGTLAVSAAYAIGSVFLGLGAQIARTLLNTSDAFVSGAILSVSAVTIGVVAILARKMRPLIALRFGPLAVLIGLAMLVGAGLTASLALFLAASLFTGAGYSLLFSGGLGLVAAGAEPAHRGGVVSTAYAAGYVVQAGTALGLGALATRAGLQTAVDVGLPVVAAFAIAALVFALVDARPVAAETGRALS